MEKPFFSLLNFFYFYFLLIFCKPKSQFFRISRFSAFRTMKFFDYSFFACFSWILFSRIISWISNNFHTDVNFNFLFAYFSLFHLPLFWLDSEIYFDFFTAQIFTLSHFLDFPSNLKWISLCFFFLLPTQWKFLGFLFCCQFPSTFPRISCGDCELHAPFPVIEILTPPK